MIVDRKRLCAERREALLELAEKWGLADDASLSNKAKAMAKETGISAATILTACSESSENNIGTAKFKSIEKLYQQNGITSDPKVWLHPGKAEAGGDNNSSGEDKKPSGKRPYKKRGPTAATQPANALVTTTPPIETPKAQALAMVLVHTEDGRLTISGAPGTRFEVKMTSAGMLVNAYSN